MTLSQSEGKEISHDNQLMNEKHCADGISSNGIIISMLFKFYSTELHSFLSYFLSSTCFAFNILFLFLVC